MRLARLLVIALVCVGLWAMALACTDPMDEALALDEQGELSAAAVAYQRIVDDDPDHVGALEGLAVCLFRLARYDEALVAQERLALLQPENARIRVELGFNYLGHQNRPADAVRVFREAVNLDGSAKNLTFLAQALRVNGDATSSERVLREAIAADPSYPRSYTALVQLLRNEGRTDEAQEVVGEATANGVTIAD